MWLNIPTLRDRGLRVGAKQIGRVWEMPPVQIWAVNTATDVILAQPLPVFAGVIILLCVMTKAASLLKVKVSE